MTVFFPSSKNEKIMIITKELSGFPKPEESSQKTQTKLTSIEGLSHSNLVRNNHRLEMNRKKK